MSIKEYRDMQKRCSSCNFCKWIPFDKVKSARFAENCPAQAYYQYNAYSARGRFQLGLCLVNDELKPEGETQKVIQSCLSCGACDVACKICRYNLEPYEHNLELKREVVKAGNELPVQTKMAESLKEEHTMLIGRKMADRDAWARGLSLTDARAESCDVLFFPGCQYAYERPEEARKAVRVLQRAGVKVGYLFDQDACCGGRMHQMGLQDSFEKAASANIAIWENVQAGCIVTPCGDCYHALKRRYAQLGQKKPVLHLTELLDQLIKEGRLTFTKRIEKTVTYHDPCHLGRLGEAYEPWNGHEKKIRSQIVTWEPRRPRYNGVHGVYDAPRDILKAIPGITLVEMERIREYSFCCGAGGGCRDVDPELSKWTAGERMEEARATGADVLVTACPWCVKNLSEAHSGMEVTDVLTLVCEALEEGE